MGIIIELRLMAKVLWRTKSASGLFGLVHDSRSEIQRNTEILLVVAISMLCSEAHIDCVVTYSNLIDCKLISNDKCKLTFIK